VAMLPIKVKKHFKSIDHRFSALSSLDVTVSSSHDHFRSLCESIVCQQLSGRAAASIWKKFIQTIKNITPKNIVVQKDELLRSTGISWSKVKYTKNVAAAFLDGTVTPEKFTRMSEDEIIAQLVKIKGVGRWTAEMFLMFSLGREDVFSAGDLGLRKGVQKLLSMKTLPSIKTMERISKKWSPYRTYAALILWKSLETV